MFSFHENLQIAQTPPLLQIAITPAARAMSKTSRKAIVNPRNGAGN
jgi:hypothetical protein